jgi:hypothetical protein
MSLGFTVASHTAEDTVTQHESVKQRSSKVKHYHRE